MSQYILIVRHCLTRMSHFSSSVFSAHSELACKLQLVKIFIYISYLLLFLEFSCIMSIFRKKKILLLELCSTSDPKKEKQNCVLVVWAMFCLSFPINVYLEVTGL